MKNKNNFKAHIETEFGGSGYKYAKTLEEAIAKCEAEKCIVKIVRRYVTEKGKIIWEKKLEF